MMKYNQQQGGDDVTEFKDRQSESPIVCKKGVGLWDRNEGYWQADDDKNSTPCQLAVGNKAGLK